MFVNKWTVRMSYPGQMIETGFDSREELIAYVRDIKSELAEDLHRVVTVLNPKGQETSIALNEAVPELSI